VPRKPAYRYAWAAGPTTRGRTKVDDLGVARSFEHDVGRLHVAMHKFLAVQRGQRLEAVANDGNRNAGLDARMHRSLGDDDPVQVPPTAIAHSSLNPCQHSRHEQLLQVVAVDPLHDHHANAIAIDEVVDASRLSC